MFGIENKLIQSGQSIIKSKSKMVYKRSVRLELSGKQTKNIFTCHPHHVIVTSHESISLEFPTWRVILNVGIVEIAHQL
ncbi:UNVERIFIED_CONTAM: hypothetical protein NCL1_24088 [Trichonephila clavipes]